METLERILGEHPFFKGLEPRYLELLVGCASNVRFNEGDYICRDGDEATQFFLIRHGKVALELETGQRGAIVIETLEAGEILGWSWLLWPYRWHFDVRATELVRAIALDGTCLRGKCDQDHDLGYELLKRFGHVVIERLKATRLQLLDVYGSP
jgi:CRP/FNR family transcriptional regulator, cyclic AMP receptor protein